MIGALPAVAVRHGRRRKDMRGGGRRPSQLPLQVGRGVDPDATPSPDQHGRRDELYDCGKIYSLYAIVGFLLLGIVVLVVGLVQLSPGAEAAQHRFYLLGAGAILLGCGVLGAVLRCLCLHWYNKKIEQEMEEAVQRANQKNAVSVVEGGHSHGHANQHQHENKPKLKSQQSVNSDADLTKQPLATSKT